MAVIVLKMTDAGLAAVQAASGTDPVSITELGLTATAFDYAPTLTALPGEFKRLDVASGVATAPNVTHLTAYDTSGDSWTATGLGLFLDDGTLFAVDASDDPVMTKVALAFGLLAFDIAFEADLAANIAYGNAVFTYPAATEETPGVAEVATQGEVDAAADDQRFVTSLKLGARLAALFAPITAAIAALTGALENEASTRSAADNAHTDALAAESGARSAADTALSGALAAEAGTRAEADTMLAAHTVTGTGLVSGGGALSTDPVLGVTAASGSELQAATEAGKAVTPASFGALPRSVGNPAFEVLPGGMLIQKGQVRTGFSVQGTVSITFPVAFADTNYDLQLTAIIPGAGDYDNYPQEISGTRTISGVSIYLQDPSGGGSATLTGFNWRAEGRA